LEICLYGDEMGCRLRQLCLFGLKESSKENILQKLQQSTATSSIRPSNSQQQLLFGGIQGDAFALFQSLATQVFGDDFAGNGEGGQQEGTLREQVMDLLFSRSQLQPLQSFVGAHISNAIERLVWIKSLDLTLFSHQRSGKFAFKTKKELLLCECPTPNVRPNVFG
jgi:hypothetical protein